MFDKPLKRLPADIRQIVSAAFKARDIQPDYIKTCRIVDDVEVTISLIDGRRFKWFFTSTRTGWVEQNIAQ